jgi:hypothetical protein
MVAHNALLGFQRFWHNWMERSCFADCSWPHLAASIYFRRPRQSYLCYRGRWDGKTRGKISYRIVSDLQIHFLMSSLTVPRSPVLCRTVMGMYGSYFFVFIRAIVATIW